MGLEYPICGNFGKGAVIPPTGNVYNLANMKL